MRSAALVAVLSPRYVKSDWCTKEVEGFRQAAEKTLGETVGNRSRIFKVVKTPVPLESHPPVVQGLLGGERVVTVSGGGRVFVWNADGSGEAIVLQAGVSSASFNVDGERVVTASRDGTARVWYADYLHRLWKRTTACLSAERRGDLLDRDTDAAGKDFQRCRRMVDCLRDGGDGAFEGCYQEFRRSQVAGD